MKATIIIIILAVVLGGGYYFFGRTEDVAPVVATLPSVTSGAPVATAPVVANAGRLFKCVSAELGTMYLAPDKTRIEIPDYKGGTIYKLFRDGLGYDWQTASTGAVKKYASGESMASKGAIDTATVTGAYYQGVSGYKFQGFSCDEWTGGSGIFDVPSGITFKSK